MRYEFTPGDRYRFALRVDRSGGPDACWPWLGPIARNSYGITSYYGGRTWWYTHRLAYAMAHGAIPDGQDVCHRCDVRRCCNPAHLFAGSRLDNMRDAMVKGRTARGRGLPNTKLSEAIVREIRRAAAAGIQGKILASQYGVSPMTVSDILRGKTWRHVT